MLASTITGAVSGVEGYLVRVDVYLANGLPSFQTVGLPDAAVREAKERVRAAVRNCGFDLPQGRIVINLAPADVRKEGSAFDLAVAVGILAAQGKVRLERLSHTLLLGELALDGALRPVPGVLAVAAHAKAKGLGCIVVPKANGSEAALIPELAVEAPATLRDVVDLLSSENGATFPPSPIESEELLVHHDLVDVKGQWRAKRALEIAAAGGHNLLFVGPPGAGKTLLAHRLPSILPQLSYEEALEVTQVHSVAGQLPSGGGLIRQPPFRAPHHTISYAAMVGGGPGPRPGEVSLAHRGVLFLDELAELNRTSLEALRQPLEDGSIIVSRARRSVRLPARFVLVGAVNPCPCGFHGDESGRCTCTPAMISRYRARISGPLLDRIDLHVWVKPLTPDELLKPSNADARNESSAAVRARVERARAIQRERLMETRSRTNAELSAAAMRKFCALDASAKNVLRRAAERLGLSARGFDRTLRVARTIADLDESQSVRAEHLQEALQYRVLENAIGLPAGCRALTCKTRA